MILGDFKAWLACVWLVATILSVSVTSAQHGLNVDADPAYGVRTFARGFAPSPFSIEMISGGENDVTKFDLGENCLGFAATNPDFVIELADEFERITVLADSKLDTTLIVNTPNGSWACNDDTNGLNPAVVISEASAGRYQIWIGSYEQGEFDVSTLWITETGPETLPTTSTGPDIMQSPTWGEITLSPGFGPIPFSRQVIGGGRNNVAEFVEADDCVGFVAEAPDFSITLEQDFENIWISVHSPANMTLLVSAVDGNWYCNDDHFGTDPSIRFSNAQAGRYDLWVGSADQGNYAASIIYVSEYLPSDSLQFTIDTDCPGLLATDLRVGSSALVARADAESIPMHAVPNMAASSVFSVDNGSLVNLVGGPICDEAHRWWRMALFEVPRGWIPDGDATASWLEIVEPVLGETDQGRD